ncbi:phage major tail tube protein [Candidatus Regiella insecticola]|uniref:Phage major tail tube protein n=1 Tax=Candidatus Regiella insecticola TaxID=138073 RepID=A0A6L2ZQ79_9ENTR|nr:phage major tail tube protein [Candidatus Regiella insecticola]GFN46368.1 phage major tail tube protein [Candidatus Regiella insecticola]
MKIPRFLKHFSVFVDGNGYAGIAEEVNLPKLSVKMEEFRAGGMDIPIDIDLGQQKLECDFVLAEYNEEVLRLWGIRDHVQVKVNFKGAIERDDKSAEFEPVDVIVQGRWRELDFGSWRPGDKTVLKVQMSVGYFKYSQKGRELVEIDAVNMKRIINGKDMLQGARSAIGI